MMKNGQDYLAMFIEENRLVRRPEVQKLLGAKSRTTLWRDLKKYNFPKPITTHNRVSCWRFKDVQQWLADQ